MSATSRLMARYRREVMAREREASKRIIEVYGRAWSTVQAEMRRFYDMLDAEARRLGVTIAEVAKLNPSWPYRAGNLQAISEQFARELRTVVMEAQFAVEEAQHAGVRLGLQHAEELIRQQVTGSLPFPLSMTVEARLAASWAAPNFAALQGLVGVLRDGRPLARLFAEYGAAAAKRMTDTLLKGFVLGKGPRQVARWLRADMGGNLSRALTVARTEMVNAYRSAKSDSLAANSDIVSGWRWLAAEDACDECAAMDGETFGADEEMEGLHPNCRCTQEPITRSYAELAQTLGIPGLADIPDRLAA